MVRIERAVMAVVSALFFVAAAVFLLVVFRTYIVAIAIAIVALGAIIAAVVLWLHLRRTYVLPIAEGEASLEMKRHVTASLIRASQMGHHFEFAAEGVVLNVINTGMLPSPAQPPTPSLPRPSVQEEVRAAPSFAESMRAGLIGPGQDRVLLCHELVRDDDGVVVDLVPRRDRLEENSTLFLGGASKSGKTTYMTHVCTQEALMGAAFYMIDPHLSHPERSLARRLEPLAGSFILPPALTDAEVFTVLAHAKAEAENRLLGKETALSGRPIVFVVDEALAALSRAQRSTNADIIALYRDLAFFMRDLGTQYAKFAMAGIFASQYITKDAFKLPGSPIDFRDGCQAQTLMRLLDAAELRGVRQLPTGHGFMGFATGEVIRMASGNVTAEDVAIAGRIVAPLPRRKQYPASTPTEPTGTRTTSGSMPVVNLGTTVIDADPVPAGVGTTATSAQYRQNRPENRVEQGSGPVGTFAYVGTGSNAQRSFRKRFDAAQELAFVRIYQETGSIKKSIATLGVSYGDYQAYASWMVQSKNLRPQI